MATPRVDWVKLIVSVGLCQMAGVIGAAFTIPNIPKWYDALSKPVIAPPGSLIGEVWLVLYALMGIAFYLVWMKESKKEARSAMDFFGLQLILNVLWSFLFFCLKSPLAGLFGIAALWLAIAYTMARFWRVSRAATYLLVPYILWVTFAGYLNFLIWRMN